MRKILFVTQKVKAAKDAAKGSPNYITAKAAAQRLRTLAGNGRVRARSLQIAGCLITADAKPETGKQPQYTNQKEIRILLVAFFGCR